ncbi:HAMP domain-containing protein, partial [Cucumibacter marinus]|uniref:HAMP domain-containing protein n=1 Tax=Cucumibacter marinus TaxID=1121252 RepID=UPI00049211A7
MRKLLSLVAKPFTRIAVRLPQLGLKTKIYAISIIMLICMAAVAGLYAYQTNELNARLAEEQAAGRNAAAVSDVAALMTDLAYTAQGFAVYSTEERLQKVERAAQALGRKLDTVTDEEEAYMVQTARNAITAVQHQIEVTKLLGLDEDSGLQGELRAATQAIEAELNGSSNMGAMVLNPIWVQLLRMRRNEKDFIMRGDEAYLAQFDEAADGFNLSVEIAPIDNAVKTKMTDFATQYSTSFHAYADGSVEYHQTIADTEQAVAEATKVSEQRRSFWNMMSANATKAVEDLRAQTQVLIYAVIGAATFAGFVIAYTVGSIVVRQVTRIEGSMQSLAEGELDIEVPYIKRLDEVGRMAQAVEVFRENAVKVAAMSEEEAARAARIAKRAEMMQTIQSAFTEVVDAAVAGDFSKRVDERVGDAELDKLSDSVNNLVETVQRGLDETARVLAALAQTDLNQRVEGHYQGSFLKLKDDTNA